jgi:hypothetical protein
MHYSDEAPGEPGAKAGVLLIPLFPYPHFCIAPLSGCKVSAAYSDTVADLKNKIERVTTLGSIR